ncbi:MAG: anaerobic sulfatase maturase [Actinomycetaceae bacterium]|nr:anaerobic sulfatase maturase [Actinomycetaceae bacterium]MDU0970572.1 anaerobic sulfatase maturase [Actinomycetaceae bacterium]
MTRTTDLAGAPLSRPRLPLQVVAKPTGAACNLDCQYCFFLSKELLYDVPRQQMPEDVLERYVAEFLAASGDGEVTMLWQGGEPTLRGLPFFRRAVQLAEQYRRPTQRVTHAIQTNGTLITDEWARFLADQDFLVGISIDGPAEYHDAYRWNRAGRGTHDLVVRGYRRLQAAGVRCNVLCTVHAANQGHPLEVYRYFRDDLGADFIQFIPIVERVTPGQAAAAERGWRAEGAGRTRVLYRQAGTSVTSRSCDPAAYGRFLAEVFDEWVRAGDVGRVFVQDFDQGLSALFGRATVCVHAPECGNNLALEFTGDVYACDHWVEPDWLLGTIADASFADLAATPRMREFARKKRLQLTRECRRCPYRFVCNGGCPKDRFVRSSDGEEGHNYLCPGYAAFYRHALPTLQAMARLLAAGRAPAEVCDPEARRALGLPQIGGER